MSTKTINQSVAINAQPHDVYEALMDSDTHAKMTGSPASISGEIGGHISAWGGYIEGDNVELVPDKLIVQNWRATDWPIGVYSIATFELRKKASGTEIIFTQTGVPSEFHDEIAKGWEDFYWTPLRDFLEAK